MPDPNPSIFRDLIHEYARGRWQAAADALRAGQAIPPPDRSSLVPLGAAMDGPADEIVGIIDRYALGAAAEAASQPARDAGPGRDFADQIDRILSGFSLIQEAEQREEKAVEAREGRPRIFQSDLWQVLYKVRESAELSYAREIDLVELDRRIVFMLHNRGPMVPAVLSSTIGVDKAQVSRSVKRLLELKMVERDQIRSPVSLSRKGEVIAERLARLAELRNRELSFDISDTELSGFLKVLELLLERAVKLYDNEREIASRSGRVEEDSRIGVGFNPTKVGEPIIIDRSRIVSPLLTLSSYFSRSGALAFKRRTGLSNFEAWVLSEISHNPPTEWSRLVKALERDHSQAGRTVNHLIEKGLVVREGKPGRRHGRFSPSEAGKRLFEIILETSRERAEFLMGPLPPDKLKAFLDTFEKIRRNAAAQLERERAFEEFERD